MSDLKKLKLFRYVAPPITSNQWEPPKGIDIRKGLVSALQEKHTVLLGEITHIEWHPDETYSDMVAKADRTYAYDSLGFPTSLQEDITYILEDGSEHDNKKTMFKKFQDYESREMASKRRKRILDDVTMQVGNILISLDPANAQAQVMVGTAFLAANKTAIDLFRDNGDPSLYSAMATAPDAWLDTDLGGYTARQVILSSINIWGL